MENFFDLSAIKLPEIKFYLYYDNNGNIIELLNYKKDSSNYVEVSEEFVTEFRESGKELYSYTLKIDDRPKVVKRLENIQIGKLFKILTLIDTSKLYSLGDSLFTLFMLILLISSNTVVAILKFYCLRMNKFK